ncbi:MAG: biotin/lipoyl-containing protein [Myxococcota bacterium]
MREATMEDFDPYRDNPLTVRDRRLGHHASAWVRSFSCEGMAILIVCRGPVRKEALDIFAQMGIEQVGILLSNKDSIVYTQALAPELRQLPPHRVHRVPDYTGATREERVARVAQIIDIAHTHGYGYIFAGYGFMAEDDAFIRAIEEAGLGFVGPCSYTAGAAGRKDEAKRTALQEEVSVTPGVNNATARTLLARAPDREALIALAAQHQLPFEPEPNGSPEVWADQLLVQSYAQGIDLYSIEALAEQLRADVAEMLAQYPGNRVRLKAIGGGGGKGQRIVPAAKPDGEGTLAERARQAASVVPGLVREILSEVKATGVGDNKNILAELNIEQTRHHEIQLIGNGQWCISLGGRDCSLQMHEQKLVEISITQEGLRDASTRAESPQLAQVLEQERAILERMEAEAERFGEAVRLDSASTFECIVDHDRHFFMEVNTRIQVEHRVSELCYLLRFTNPYKPNDSFTVDSLVEMMALLARHKERLPKPTREQRSPAAAEVRLNATDRALQPHAGGLILDWSPPQDFEVRDDQGICAPNPATGRFIPYRLAGAYDSNIALLVTTGSDRRNTFERLYTILRRTRIDGQDLATNLQFHHGIVSWLLGHDPHARITTRFVVPYLTLVGLLKEAANGIDLEIAFKLIQAHHLQQLGPAATAERQKATRAAIVAKHTLLKRPLRALLDEPHLLSGWLALHSGSFSIAEETGVVWHRNPLQLLAEIYHHLNMEHQPGLPAAHTIWSHDRELLDRGLAFYRHLDTLLGTDGQGQGYAGLAQHLESDVVPSGVEPGLWPQIRASHTGFQAGLELLKILPVLGAQVGFEELTVRPDLSVVIPERLTEPTLQTRMRKVLVPPPVTKSDEIVAPTGGMFYAQEAPDMPPMIASGEHFEAGQPLFIIEVMKMFNKVAAPFAGTIREVLIEGNGTIVRKGQPLFRVDPDERIEAEDPAEVAARCKASTERFMAQVLR